MDKCATKGWTWGSITYSEVEGFDANGTWELTNLVYNNWFTSLLKEFNKSMNLSLKCGEDKTKFTMISSYFTSTTWLILLATKAIIPKVTILS